jgi:hypothetical protein
MGTGTWIATDAKTHPRKDRGNKDGNGDWIASSRRRDSQRQTGMGMGNKDGIEGWIATDEYILAKTDGEGAEMRTEKDSLRLCEESATKQTRNQNETPYHFV